MSRRGNAWLGRLRRDARGVAAVEFAMVAPVLFLLLIGVYDMGHTAYVSAVLHGAVKDVARDAGLEGTSTTKADTYVRSLVRRVAPEATVTATRTSYYDFSDIARPEAFNDQNANGVCDNSEGYTDENRNGRWDADIGQDGNGGANDVVLYTVQVVYKPLFPLPILDNSDQMRTITAKAVQKNQPYALQGKYGSQAGTCN